MTKAEERASGFIRDFLANPHTATFSWKELSAFIKSYGNPPKNWMTIRGIIQHYINEGLIERTNSVHVEEYQSAIN